MFTPPLEGSRPPLGKILDPPLTGVWAWVWARTRSPSTSPWGMDLDQMPLNIPLGCGPGPDPPKLPPWVWAWRPPAPGQIPLNSPPWVWAWKPARHAGTPPWTVIIDFYPKHRDWYPRLGNLGSSTVWCPNAFLLVNKKILKRTIIKLGLFLITASPRFGLVCRMSVKRATSGGSTTPPYGTRNLPMLNLADEEEKTT